MGFGKAHKQARNLKRKKEKKELELKKNLELISNMEDNRVYSIKDDNGVAILNGMMATGKIWKSFYGLIK